MAGELVLDTLQLGDDANPARNLVLRTNQDGSFTLARGKIGATTQDILQVLAGGQIITPQNRVVWHGILGGDQSIASGVTTKIALNGSRFNVGGGVHDVAAYRYTPKVPGLYLIMGQAAISMPAAGSATTQTTIGWNGSGVALATVTVANIANTYTPATFSLVQMNGTTDYLELFGYQNSGTNRTVLSGAANTFLSAVLLGAQ